MAVLAVLATTALHPLSVISSTSLHDMSLKYFYYALLVRYDVYHFHTGLDMCSWKALPSLTRNSLNMLWHKQTNCIDIVVFRSSFRERCRDIFRVVILLFYITQWFRIITRKSSPVSYTHLTLPTILRV